MEEGRSSFRTLPSLGEKIHHLISEGWWQREYMARNKETRATRPRWWQKTTKAQMVLKEFGAIYAEKSSYLFKRLTMKGWRGKQRPALKNSLYKATPPAQPVVTLSLGSGADNCIPSEILYLALRFSTSMGVMVEETPSRPAELEVAVGEGAGRTRAAKGSRVAIPSVLRCRSRGTSSLEEEEEEEEEE